jgi:methionine-rich copper-binding protein CopC
VLTLDFVSAYVEDSTPFYVTNVTDDAELVESPQQVTLRFTPGVEIDSSQTSLDGISVFRSGGADDSFAPFGSLSDQQILPGEIIVDDFPNENQVVIRFADKLVDDTYRISISSDLQSINGESFRGGESFSFDFRLSLGQQITSVVPQPIVRASDVTVGLTQSRNVIEVYFDANEELDADSAQTAGHYKLIAIDEATGADIGTPGDETVPDSVVYDSESHKATLTFLPGDIADGVLYRLEVGGAGIITPADPVVEQVT